MRSHGQASGLRRKQASYYERRSGTRAALAAQISDTFAPRGANHETTNLGPDKTAWLGRITIGLTRAMELAAGPDRLDEALGEVLPVESAIRAVSDSHFPPDIAESLREDDRRTEYDQRELTPPSPYMLLQEGPPTPPEIAEQALKHIEERQQGES